MSIEHIIAYTCTKEFNGKLWLSLSYKIYTDKHILVAPERRCSGSTLPDMHPACWSIKGTQLHIIAIPWAFLAAG